MQREAMESMLERTPSSTLRTSSAHTPRILQSTSRDDTVPGPDQSRSRWPESIRPQLDRTSQCRQPTPPSNTRRFDSPLRRNTKKSVSEVLRFDDTRTSDAAIAHTLHPGSVDRFSESEVQSASQSSFQSWSSPADFSSTSVDSSDFHCRGFSPLPLRRISFMGSQDVIARSERTMVGKRQNSNVLHPIDISK